MQVSDAGALMRATLQASKILIELRGMQPLVGVGDELNVRQWLARRDTLEDLDAALFEEVAHTFVAELLDHERKQTMLGRVAEAQAQRKKETTGAETRLRMCGKVYSFSRLTSNQNEFLPHLYPLLFAGAPAAHRPHAHLDYRLAAIVHTGHTVKRTNETIKSIIERIDAVRRQYAAQFGYTAATAGTMPCRVLLVLWGAAFYPKTGRAFNTMRNGLAALSAKQRESGSNITFEMFSVVELQYDAAAHQDVSQHSVVAEPSAVAELRTTRPHQLAYIRETDIQARLRDYRVGQVIRVDRVDFELAGRSHDYRIVVPHDYVLEKTATTADDGE